MHSVGRFGLSWSRRALSSAAASRSGSAVAAPTRAATGNGPRLHKSALAAPAQILPRVASTRFFAASAADRSAAKSDGEVAEFLTEEIAAEKKNLQTLPQLQGFEVKTEGGELTFTKHIDSEKVIVSLNVNHTVDSAEPDDGAGSEAPDMKSKPNFEVDIIKANGKTLSFSCSYVTEPEADNPPDQMQQEGYEDVFAIDEVTMYVGEEWTEKHYAVAGDILDGYLYDLFMNMLEERGVSSDFVDKLSAYCSAYEHSQYIKLLEDVQQFCKM